MNRWMFLILARLEGVSLLLLFGVAMPLKYVWGQPEAVSLVGLTHGLLFIAYVLALSALSQQEGWSWRRVGLGLIAAVLPAGTFVFEARLPPLPGPTAD